MEIDMKLVCVRVLRGKTYYGPFTLANGDPGGAVISIAGVGNPFWVWDLVPTGTILDVDFTNAPICNSDPAVNNAAIAAITALPGDVITFAP